MFQYLNYKAARKRRTTARNWKLIWTNNEGKLPNLAKEKDFQEAQRVPKKLDQKRNTPRRIIVKLPKIKDKERILKAAREKQSYLQRSSHKIINWFLKWNFAGKKGLARSIQSDEKQGPTYNQDYSIQQNHHLESKGR